MATRNSTNQPLLLEEHLDKLPGHINTVLIQIGKLLKHQLGPDHKLIDRPKYQIQEAISKQTRLFHDSLDDVELAILDAKAVVERDINKIRARQAELEAAKQALLAEPEPEPAPQIEVPEDVVMVEAENVLAPDQAEAPLVEGDASLAAKMDANGAGGVENATVDDPTAEDANQNALSMDDLFGDGNDFGPVDENTDFDFGAADTSFMDFSMPTEPASNEAAQVLPATSVEAQGNTPPTTNGETIPSNNLTDNDNFMQELGSLVSTDGFGSNEFGDMTFDTMDENQKDSNYDPFAPPVDDEFDFFN